MLLVAALTAPVLGLVGLLVMHAVEQRLDAPCGQPRVSASTEAAAGTRPALVEALAER